MADLIRTIKDDERALKYIPLSPENRKFYDAYRVHWVHGDKRKTLTEYICKQFVRALKG